MEYNNTGFPFKSEVFGYGKLKRDIVFSELQFKFSGYITDQFRNIYLFNLVKTGCFFYFGKQ